MLRRGEIRAFNGAHYFLSNFYPVSVEYGRVEYPSVEHAYQAAKTTDKVWRARIREAATAAKAKSLGKRVPLRDDWDSLKLEVMRKLIKRKFRHPPLRIWLLKTGQAFLVEGNTWGDTFWGVCNGRGKNHLGRLLMRERDRLRGVAAP